MQERADFFARLEDSLRALPGIRSVGAISTLPFAGAGSQGPYAYDQETAEKWESVTADARTVTPSYLDAAGYRLMSGRSFDDADSSATTRVVIVDESLARKAWRDQDPLGKLLQLPVIGPAGVTREWHEVIGVVRHARIHDLSKEVREQVYFPERQRGARTMTLAIRVSGDPSALADSARRTVHAMNPDLPLADLQPMAEKLSASLVRTRFTVILFGVFGGVALVLATVGLYGVISCAVSQRSRELGIRLALGAATGGIVRLVLRQAMVLTAVGISVGLLVALAAGRLLSALLFRIGAADPTTFAAAAGLVVAVALVASLLPARRASGLDPITTLRCD